MKRPWLIRCDATAIIGLGHLARCVAVAEALRAEGQIVRLIGNVDSEFLPLLRDAGVEFVAWKAPTGSPEDARDVALQARSAEACGVFADDYRIGPDWARSVASAWLPPVLLDDFAARGDYSACRGIINFTIGAAQLVYPDLSAEQTAAGPAFFPARSSHVTTRKSTDRRDRSLPARNVLVCLGGTAALEVLSTLLDSLWRVASGTEVRAVVPAALLGEICARYPGTSFFGIGTDMASHYLWADACICAGGLMKYECAYLGLPSAVYSLNSGQRSDTRLFAERNMACDLCAQGMMPAIDDRLRHFLTDPVLRSRISKNCLDAFPANSSSNLARRLISWSA